MTFKDFVQICENYGDAKYSPKNLQKELPGGYSYGKEEQGKGDHKRATMQVKSRGKTTDTDMKIGGAHGGRGKYSPSWKATHDKHKKTLSGIDREVRSIQNEPKREPKKKDTAKRMASSFNTRAKKALSDVTGVGRKTNVQGAGNKAKRRMEGLKK